MINDSLTTEEISPHSNQARLNDVDSISFIDDYKWHPSFDNFSRYADLVLNNEPLSITFTEEDDSLSRDGKTRHSPQKRRLGASDDAAAATAAALGNTGVSGVERPTPDGRATVEGRAFSEGGRATVEGGRATAEGRAISDGRATSGGRLTGYDIDAMPSEEAAMKKVSSGVMSRVRGSGRL